LTRVICYDTDYFVKNIRYKDEQRFYDSMIKKGKRLIIQPYLKQFKIRPDFYCIDEDTFYEVISTRQAYHSRKDRINAAIKKGLKIKIVNPDGTEYHSKKPKLKIQKPIKAAPIYDIHKGKLIVESVFSVLRKEDQNI